MSTEEVTLLIGIGILQAFFAAIGYLIGYVAGARGRAAIAADAVAVALPALIEKIELDFGTTRLNVPVTVTADVEAAPMAPVYIPIETYPAPTNVELAQRIFAELGDIGSRPLAEILSLAPSSAHALRTRILAEQAGSANPE